MFGELEEFLKAHIDKPMTEWVARGISPNEAMETLWQLNDLFRPHVARIQSVRYEARFEDEADAALIAFAWKPDVETWASLPAGVWRVLCERHTQMLTVCAANLAQGEPRMTVMPADLPPDDLLSALVLFWHLRMKLLLPPAEPGHLALPEGTHPGPLRPQ